MRTDFGALLLLSACGNAPTSAVFTPLAGPDGGYVFIGSSCTPALENDPSFGGFSSHEVSIESRSGQPPGAPVCLVYFFQGRVSCPYGQTSPSPAGSAACTTPKGQSVVVPVAPQCFDRRASDVVVWSCKCGDGAPGDRYCDCPSGTSCLPIGAGSYCLPSSTTESPSCTVECEPGAHPCN
jgi:hypothetical protein